MRPKLRFFFYSHDGLGLGHTRRNLAIASALIDLAPEASILLATGTDEASRFGIPPGVDVLKLPGLRKVANEQYVARRLHISAADHQALRSALLTAAVQSFRPTVMLVDKHPLGANGELRLAIEELRAVGGQAVLGLRDILDDRMTVLDEWTRHNLQRYIAEHYDRVLIYGLRTMFDPIAEYEFPVSLAERTQFCGYVVGRSDTEIKRRAEDLRSAFPVQPRTRPVVLATSGGGEDGFPLLKTFIQAASGAPWHGMVIAGPLADGEQCQTLRRLAAEAGVAFHTFIPGLSGQFGQIDALVCKGGYNTLGEAVASGIPTVCVPRTFPRKEQLIRAKAFARRGLVRFVEPDQLDADRLRLEVTAALQASRQELREQAHALLDFDGARQAAACLLELAESAETPSAVLAARPAS